MGMRTLVAFLLTQRVGMAKQQFMQAVQRDDAVQVETLLREDRTLAVATDEFGETALHKASKLGNISAAEKLIKGDKACVDIASRKEGYTAVHFAVAHGHPEMLLLLLHNNANRDPVANESHHRCTPLHIASKGNQVACVKALVDVNCRINSKNKQGKVPLHFAAAGGNAEVVRCLLNAGCETDLIDMHGCTALHFASEGGHTSIVELLTRSPFLSNPTICNKNNQTAEQLAQHGRHKRVASFLREYKKKYEEWVRHLKTNVPISKIKLYVCGETGVGKSSLLETLQQRLLRMRSQSLNGNTDQQSTSVGIRIKNVSIGSNGWFSAWDVGGTMAGNVGIEYLLSSVNAVYLLVLSLQSNIEELKQQIRRWLSLISTCGLADGLTKGAQPSVVYKPTVLLVLSHADMVGDAIQQRGIVAVYDAASLFVEKLDILGDIKVFCVNSTSSDFQMGQLKETICQKHRLITRRHPHVPLFCEVLADSVNKSMTERALAPIALLTDFRSSFVTKINPLATRNDLDQAVLVLSMAGRVVHTRWAVGPNRWIVLDPDWLCNRLFKAVHLSGVGRFLKLAADKQGFVSMENLKEEFPEVNRDQVAKMLEDFGVAYQQKCSHCCSTRLEIPSLMKKTYRTGIELWKQQDEYPIYSGRRIRCNSESAGNVFPFGLFSKFQVVTRTTYGGDIPLWHGGLIIPYPSKSLVQVLVEAHDDCIDISVRGSAVSSQKCFEHLNTVWRLLHNTIQQTCPVVRLQVDILSVHDLQAHLETAASYSLTDVINAERQDLKLFHPDGFQESPVDLLYCSSPTICHSMKEPTMPAWYLPIEVIQKVEEVFGRPAVRDCDAKADWIRLAEQLGMTKMIGILALTPKKAFHILLEQWTTNPHCSVMMLIQALNAIERGDVAAVITRHLPTFQ